MTTDVHITYAPIVDTTTTDQEKVGYDGNQHKILVKSLSLVPTSDELNEKILAFATPKLNATRFRIDNDAIQHIITLLRNTQNPPSRIVINSLLGVLEGRNEDRLRMTKNGIKVNANDELVTQTLGRLILSLQKKFPVGKVGRDSYWLPDSTNRVHDIIQGANDFSELEYLTRYFCRLFHQDIVFLRRCDIVSSDENETQQQKLARVSLLGQVIKDEYEEYAHSVLKLTKNLSEISRTLFADICELLHDDQLVNINLFLMDDYLLDYSVNVLEKESLLAQLSTRHRRALAITALRGMKMCKADKDPTDFLEFTSVVLSRGHLTQETSIESFEQEWSLYYAFMSALLSATDIEQEKHHIYVHALLAQFEMVQTYLHDSQTNIESYKELYELFSEMFEDILKVQMPQSSFKKEEIKDEEDVNNTSDSSDESDEDGVFCICRGPEKGFMIQCAVCDEWYHGRCVKITETQAKKIKEYVCDPCAESGRAALSPNSRKRKTPDEPKTTNRRPRKRRTLTKKLTNNT